MKNQLSFADIEQSAKTRVTKRERFLSDMDAIVPFKKFGTRQKRKSYNYALCQRKSCETHRKNQN
jgi:hypothetical protein